MSLLRLCRPVSSSLRVRSVVAPPPLVRSIASTSSSSAASVSSHSDHGTDDPHGHHGHESHYDEPTGWLWGIPPGEKYEKEGWEPWMYYGFLGSIFITGVAYVFKPDTSIQTWALEEARRRLEKEGILEDPDNKSA